VARRGAGRSEGAGGGGGGESGWGEEVLQIKNKTLTCRILPV